MGVTQRRSVRYGIFNEGMQLDSLLGDVQNGESRGFAIRSGRFSKCVVFNTFYGSSNTFLRISGLKTVSGRGEGGRKKDTTTLF